MPVWHERTRDAREAGALILVGIAEEQHPERCELFARWQGLDWPILWDPFNLTGSSAVPVAIGIDEHGIVREVGMSLDELDAFLEASFEPLPSASGTEIRVGKDARGPRDVDGGASISAEEALSRLLWSQGTEGQPLTGVDFQVALAALERSAAGSPEAATAFRLGVARRMRYDSPAAQPEDFQASLDLWRSALARDPTQYIWRRRIQQWGPRLDKPYPFYDWIERARADLRARGELLPELVVALTSSEVSGRDGPTTAARIQQHPDPEGKVPRDAEGWIAVDVAVAPHTEDGGPGSTASSAQVHLVLRPKTSGSVHWGNEAGPTWVWIEDAEGLGLPPGGFELPLPDAPESAEPRRLDFTVRPGAPGRVVRGTTFYFVCAEAGGECRFLAQDFRAALPGGGEEPR